MGSIKKNKKNNDSCSCCSILFVFIFIILIAFFIVEMAAYSKNSSLNEHTCQIVRVDYPIILPIMGSTEFWRTCDCGRNCQAWGPTVTLYTNVSDQPLHENVRVPESQTYTFFDTSCSNGEDVRFTQIYMEDARDIALDYINNTVTCYYRDLNSAVYMNYVDNLTNIIGLSCGLGIILIIFIASYINDYRHTSVVLDV
jgi:hypothetical protein